MYCIHVDIPHYLCEIDDELKAIYHSKDNVCIWVFTSVLLDWKYFLVKSFIFSYSWLILNLDVSSENG